MNRIRSANTNRNMDLSIKSTIIKGKKALWWLQSRQHINLLQSEPALIPFQEFLLEYKTSIGRFIDGHIDFSVNGEAPKSTNLLSNFLRKGLCCGFMSQEKQASPDLILVTAEGAAGALRHSSPTEQQPEDGNAVCAAISAKALRRYDLCRMIKYSVF